MQFKEDKEVLKVDTSRYAEILHFIFLDFFERHFVDKFEDLGLKEEYASLIFVNVYAFYLYFTNKFALSKVAFSLKTDVLKRVIDMASNDFSKNFFENVSKEQIKNRFDDIFVLLDSYFKAEEFDIESLTKDFYKISCADPLSKFTPEHLLLTSTITIMMSNASKLSDNLVLIPTTKKKTCSSQAATVEAKVFDCKTGSINTIKSKIDTNKYPKEKYANENGTYYALRNYKSSEGKLSLCAPAFWKKYVNEQINNN